MAITRLPLDRIRTDGETQPREVLSEEVIADYTEDLKRGATFPPVIAVDDGKDCWLADGFHRVAAFRAAKRKDIAVDLRKGARRDAILLSCGVNTDHGLRRTNADKRRAVLKLLNDPEWTRWSDREIAKRCAVHNTFVSRIRQESLSVAKQQIETARLTTRGNTTYKMKTEEIGKKPKKTMGGDGDGDEKAPAPNVPMHPIEDPSGTGRPIIQQAPDVTVQYLVEAERALRRAAGSCRVSRWRRQIGRLAMLLDKIITGLQKVPKVPAEK